MLVGGRSGGCGEAVAVIPVIVAAIDRGAHLPALTINPTHTHTHTHIHARTG